MNQTPKLRAVIGLTAAALCTLGFFLYRTQHLQAAQRNPEPLTGLKINEDFLVETQFRPMFTSSKS
ncbi:MAG: hypothetical protein V4671_17880, partial [Armatimonadota bacterium]